MQAMDLAAKPAVQQIICPALNLCIWQPRKKRRCWDAAPSILTYRDRKRMGGNPSVDKDGKKESW